MSREIFSTDAPLSAAGSAAQRAYKDNEYPNTIHAIAPHGEILAKEWAKEWAEDWPEDLPEDLSDSASEIEARPEARVDGGGSRAHFLAVVESGDGGSKAQSAIRDPRNVEYAEMAEHAEKTPQSAIRNSQSAISNSPRRPGLKKLNKKQIALDWPPTPRGCEWRRSDDGMNLWHCWTERDDDKSKRIKKSRYAGHLSDDAWRIMKEYDHEAFISVIGERLRRHSGR